MRGLPGIDGIRHMLAGDGGLRLLGGAVGALLAANLLAVGLHDDDRPAPPPLEEAGGDEGDVEMIVTTADGRQYLADPTTPEGRQAIDNAVEQGAAVMVRPAPRSPDGGTGDEVEPATEPERRTRQPTTSTTRRKGGGSGGPVTATDAGGSTPTTPTTSTTLPPLPLELPDPGTTVTTITDTLDGVVGTVKDTVDGIGDTVGGITSTTLPPVTVPPTTLPPLSVTTTTLATDPLDDLLDLLL